MDLVEVSKDVNEKKRDYKIGQLQVFRARIKNLKKVSLIIFFLTHLRMKTGLIILAGEQNFNLILVLRMKSYDMELLCHYNQVLVCLIQKYFILRYVA